MVKQIFEKCRGNNFEVYQIFGDFKDAYGTINHPTAKSTMIDMLLSSKYANWPFATQTAFKQLKISMLFTLALKYVVRKLPIETKGPLLFKSDQIHRRNWHIFWCRKHAGKAAYGKKKKKKSG